MKCDQSHHTGTCGNLDGHAKVVEQRQHQVGRRAVAADIKLAALGLLHKDMSWLEFMQRLAALVRKGCGSDSTSQ